MDKNFEDYYDILGVDSKATNATIRKAFQFLIKKNHPDKNPRQTASDLDSCKRIIKAYKVLSDPSQRKEYDRNYQERKKRQQTNANQQGRGNKESHGSNSQKQKENFKPHDNQNGHSSGNQEKKKYEHRPKSEQKENNHNGHSSYNQERSHQQNTGQQRRPNSEQKEKPKPHYNHNAHSSGNEGRHDWHRQDERDQNQSNFQNRHHAYYQESWQEDYDLYEMLGLRNNATQNDIQNAYFNLTQRFSQENANPATTKIYAKILKAYIILSDPELRNNYDSQRNKRNQFTNSFRNIKINEVCRYFCYGLGIYLSYIWRYPIGRLLKDVCYTCLGIVNLTYTVFSSVIFILYSATRFIFRVLPPVCNGLIIVIKCLTEVICFPLTVFLN